MTQHIVISYVKDTKFIILKKKKDELSKLIFRPKMLITVLKFKHTQDRHIIYYDDINVGTRRDDFVIEKKSSVN